MKSILFTPPWYVGVGAGALTMFVSVKWLLSKSKDPPSLLSSLDPRTMASCAINDSLSVVKTLCTGRRAGCADDETRASIEQKLEPLQRYLHFELGRTLFGVAEEEIATAAAPIQQTVTLVPPLLGRLWKDKDILAYSTAAVTCLFGGLWCFKMYDISFNEISKSSIGVIASVAAASAFVALSAMPSPPQPPSPALSATRRLVDHFVHWFINQSSRVPNGIITIFKNRALEFHGRHMPTSVSSRTAWTFACVVGLALAWPCINWFIGCWLITGIYNLFFYSSTECEVVEFTVPPGQCILMEFDAHGVQIDFDVSSTQHNDEAAAKSSASTGALLFTAGVVSVWVCSALLIPFPANICFKGMNVCKGLMFALSALFWFYGSQTSTSCDFQRTLPQRQSCSYDIIPFVNFEEHPIQLRVLFTDKTSVFAEPKNIQLKSSYSQLRWDAEKFDSYKQLLRWRDDSSTASDYRIWTPRSSLHPIVSLIAQSVFGWIACVCALIVARYLYDVVSLLHISVNEQTSSQAQSSTSRSWSSKIFPAQTNVTSSAAPTSTAPQPSSSRSWSSKIFPAQTNVTSSAAQTSTAPQPSRTSSSYLGSSLSYLGGWARYIGSGCVKGGTKSATFVKDSTLYLLDRCIVRPSRTVWQNVIPGPVKVIVAYGVWTQLKGWISSLEPVWGVLCCVHVNVAMPVGKRLMSPVFEQMSRDTPFIDLTSRIHKLNENIMAIVTPPKSQDEFELHGQVFAELLQIRSCLLAHASFSQEENFKSQIKSLENVMKKYGSLSSTQVIIAWLEVSKLKLN